MDHVGFVYMTTRPVAWPAEPVVLATSESELLTYLYWQRWHRNPGGVGVPG